MSKPDPRLPPSADEQPREPMPPEGVVEYEAIGLPADTDTDTDTDEDSDAEIEAEYNAAREDEVPARPRMLVLPEVVEAFPDHELLETNTQTLPCRLTQSERLAQGEKLAHLAGKLETHRLVAKEAKAQLKADENAIQDEIAATAKILRTGAEERSIATAVLADYRTNEAKTIRQDTLEVLWSRSLTPEERQRVLFPNPTRPSSSGSAP